MFQSLYGEHSAQEADLSVATGIFYMGTKTSHKEGNPFKKILTSIQTIYGHIFKSSHTLENPQAQHVRTMFEALSLSVQFCARCRMLQVHLHLYTEIESYQNSARIFLMFYAIHFIC